MTDEETITNCQRPVVIARIITHIHHISLPILLLLLTIVMTMMMTAAGHSPQEIPPEVKNLLIRKDVGAIANVLQLEAVRRIAPGCFWSY